MSVSCYRGCYIRDVAGEMLLSQFLGSECCANPLLLERISALRSFVKDTPEYNRLKKQIPCATVSCVCKDRRSRECVIKRNPLIVLDIDLKENPRLESNEYKNNLMEGLMRWPYIYAVGTSCSGKGVFAIVLLSSNKNKQDFLGAFNALEEDFSNVNIILDKQCKDVTRLRIASSDPILIKPPTEEILPYQRRVVKEPKTLSLPHLVTAGTDHDEVLAELIDMLISHGYSTENYDDWIKDGFLLRALGQSGYDLFLRISSSSPNFLGEQDVRQKWEQLSNSTCTPKMCLAVFKKKVCDLIGPSAYSDAMVNVLKRHVR